MPRARANRSRRWCVTLNNYTLADINNFRAAVSTPNSSIKYIVFQEEVGENGTAHLQAYVELEAQATMTRLKNQLGRRIHCEVARGSSKQASDYCKKDDTRKPGTTFTEVGDRFRTKAENLEEVTEQIKQGKSIQNIALDNSVLFVHHHRGLERLKDATMKHRTENPVVVINWGESGAGKSYSTLECIKEQKKEAYYIPNRPRTGKWFWEGYNYEELCVIDDFKPSHFKMHDLMALMNNTPFNVETKFGHKKLRMTELIINSNEPPAEWYKGVPDEVQGKKALLRRMQQFATIIKWTGCWKDDPDNITKEEEYTEEEFQFIPYENKEEYNFSK